MRNESKYSTQKAGKLGTETAGSRPVGETCLLRLSTMPRRTELGCLSEKSSITDETLAYCRKGRAFNSLWNSANRDNLEQCLPTGAPLLYPEFASIF